MEAQEEDDTENLTEKAPTDTGQTGKKKKKKEKSKDDNESQSNTSESQPQTERKKKETSKEQEAVSQESKKEKKKKKQENKFKLQHEEVSSTTASGEEELLSHVRAGQQQGRMLVKVADPWLDEQVCLVSCGSLAMCMALSVLQLSLCVCCCLHFSCEDWLLGCVIT